MTQTMIEMKRHVAAVMPLLHANLNTAHNEWMAGKIPKGAFIYCLDRHQLAVELTSEPADKLDQEVALAAGARLFLDLRSAINDLPEEDRPKEQKKVDALLAFYVQNGFTEMHPEFEIPLRPAAQGH